MKLVYGVLNDSDSAGWGCRMAKRRGAVAMQKLPETAGLDLAALLCSRVCHDSPQTFVLFPVLDDRIELIQAGQEPPASWHHIGYIIGEVIKLILLIALFYNNYRLMIKK